MSYRTTGVLFVIAVLLSLYVVFIEAGRVPGQTGPGKVFIDLEPSDVTSLEIVYRGEDAEARAGLESTGKTEVKISMRRSEHLRWVIEEPVSYPGLLPRIQGLTWTLADLVQVARVEEGTSAWNQAIPSAGASTQIRFETRQGQKHSVEIGIDYPEISMNFLYLRIDGDQVTVSKQGVRSDFAVGLDDLRDRALFPIAPQDCLEFRETSRQESESKHFVREGDQSAWIFRGEPGLDSTRTDRVKTEAFIRILNTWAVHEFEVDAEEDLQADVLQSFGLDDPQFRIYAKHVGGAEVSLDVGREFKRDGHDLVYLLETDNPRHVVSASSEPLEALRLKRETFRTLHAFDFGFARVMHLELQSPKGKLSLDREKIVEKNAAPGSSTAEYRWMVRSGSNSSPLLGDRRLINVAVAELQELVIQKFLPPVSEAERKLYDRSIEIRLDTGESYHLWLGPHSEDPRDAKIEVFHAIRSTDQNHILVETYWPERIDLGEYVFRNRAISTLERQSIYKLKFSTPAAKWTLFRIPNEKDWTMMAGATMLPGTKVDQKLVNDFVSAVSRHRFSVWRFDPKLDANEYSRRGIGLSEYRAAVTITAEGQKGGFRRLVIGDPLRDSEPRQFYALADSHDTAFLLTAEVPGLLLRITKHLSSITGDE